MGVGDGLLRLFSYLLGKRSDQPGYFLQRLPGSKACLDGSTEALRNPSSVAIRVDDERCLAGSLTIGQEKVAAERRRRRRVFFEGGSHPSKSLFSERPIGGSIRYIVLVRCPGAFRCGIARKERRNP